MFTKTPHTIQVTQEEYPPVLIASSDGCEAMVVQPIALDSTGEHVVSAIEQTFVAPGRWTSDFTWRPIPACGHAACSPGRLAVSLN